MNGYCQSLGWTPRVRVMANWIPVTRRGKVIGIVRTGYQITAALSGILAGYSAQLMGWRGAMLVPAGVLAICPQCIPRGLSQCREIARKLCRRW